MEMLKIEKTLQSVRELLDMLSNEGGGRDMSDGDVAALYYELKNF